MLTFNVFLNCLVEIYGRTFLINLICFGSLTLPCWGLMVGFISSCVFYSFSCRCLHEYFKSPEAIQVFSNCSIFGRIPCIISVLARWTIWLVLFLIFIILLFWCAVFIEWSGQTLPTFGAASEINADASGCSSWDLFHRSFVCLLVVFFYTYWIVSRFFFFFHTFLVSVVSCSC